MHPALLKEFAASLSYLRNRILLPEKFSISRAEAAAHNLVSGEYVPADNLNALACIMRLQLLLCCEFKIDICHTIPTFSHAAAAAAAAPAPFRYLFNFIDYTASVPSFSGVRLKSGKSFSLCAFDMVFL